MGNPHEPSQPSTLLRFQATGKVQPLLPPSLCSFRAWVSRPLPPFPYPCSTPTLRYTWACGTLSVKQLWPVTTRASGAFALRALVLDFSS